jgi:hypothetical protein
MEDCLRVDPPRVAGVDGEASGEEGTLSTVDLSAAEFKRMLARFARGSGFRDGSGAGAAVGDDGDGPSVPDAPASRSGRGTGLASRLREGPGEFWADRELDMELSVVVTMRPKLS